MKLRSVAISGFGCLTQRRFTFGEGLNVVYGPNEAGKSTLSAAILASLYGLGRRKEFWRPWTGDAYGTVLVYELAGGQMFEVQRDFARDAKGTRVYDRDGNDVAAQLAAGKTIAPGEVHLHVPYDAFVNAACVLQQNVEVDVDRNTAIATALARALDGGPKEDAALGALGRLDAALRAHVGTARATKNNPLRDLRTALAAVEREAQTARHTLDFLAGLRERRALAIADRERLVERRATAEHERKALRAADLRARLEDLRACREDISALQTECERYDDVAAFPAERVTDLDAAFYIWESAQTVAAAAEAADVEARLTADELAEFEERTAAAGAIDDAAFDDLRAAAAEAETARTAAAAAANDAAALRRDGAHGSEPSGPLLAVAGVVAAWTIAAAIARWWSLTALCGVLTVVAFGIITVRSRERMRRDRVAAEKDASADRTRAADQTAAAALAAVLDRLQVSGVEELAHRRERLTDLRAKQDRAERAAARAASTRENEIAAGAAFDRLADEIVPATGVSRVCRRAAAAARATRRRERDGIESGIAMLALRRGEILRGEDEFALIAERDALAVAGIVPAGDDLRAGAATLAAELEELERLVHQADVTVAGLGGELEQGESKAPDLAAIEEEVERLRGEIDRLETFGRALNLASETLTRLTKEAHQAFARRLETYAAEPLRTVTAGRYGEIFVDPTSLAVRVRIPENDAIEDLDVLSAGTRDQVYLVVRFAMARMFAEGLETPPLLLDDPFAYWDDERIERCLPIVAENAFGAQTVLFTSSRELTAAAVKVGAHRIELNAVAAVLG